MERSLAEGSNPSLLTIVPPYFLINVGTGEDSFFYSKLLGTEQISEWYHRLNYYRVDIAMIVPSHTLATC